MPDMAPYPGAFSDAQVPWATLQCNRVSRNVRRLQARMVKATPAQRWGTVQALPRLLPRSCRATVRARRRVTANPGTHTPGGAGAGWHTPEKPSPALNELQPPGERPAPRQRGSIPNADGRQRPRPIPPRLDRARQTRALPALAPRAAGQAAPPS